MARFATGRDEMRPPSAIMTQCSASDGDEDDDDDNNVLATNRNAAFSHRE